MEQELYILDIIGTFAFAMYGSYFALEKKFDILGISVAAFLTAFGGGTIREILLNNIPFYLYDMNYIIAIIVAIIFTIFIFKKFDKIQQFALFIDSIGLVTFAFIGASKASEFGFGIFGITFFAAINAVGGGALRDVVLNKIPQIMYYDCYASIAILLGITYSLLNEYMINTWWANGVIGIFLCIRLLSIVYKVNLWKPKL